MKVWIIQTGEPLPLASGTRWMRSALLARELAKRGHRVTWWASAFDHYRRAWASADADGKELQTGLTLRTLRGVGYSASLSLRRLVDHAVVARAFAREVKTAERPDVIVAALPDYRIAHAAWRYARRHAIPFVLDLRDRWPWDFVEHFPAPLRPLARAGLVRDFAMARILLAKADSVVTMMEKWGDWIAREGPRSPHGNDRVFYLGAERLAADPARVRDPVLKALAAAKGSWPILFVGAFTNRSWPRQAIAAFRLLKGNTGAVRPLLILAGDGDRRQDVEELAADDPDIVLPGFVNDAEIEALLAISKVGVTTLNGDYEAVPNKVFTYLSGGLPIISSIGGELEALLEREDIGFSCDSSAEMAAALEALLTDEPRRAEMAARAQRLFDEKYEARKLFGAYADHVEAVARCSLPEGRGR